MYFSHGIVLDNSKIIMTFKEAVDCCQGNCAVALVVDLLSSKNFSQTLTSVMKIVQKAYINVSHFLVSDLHTRHHEAL